MCRDQNLISETDGRTYGRTYGRTKSGNPHVGRPLLGPAKITQVNLTYIHTGTNEQKFKLPHTKNQENIRRRTEHLSGFDVLDFHNSAVFKLSNFQSASLFFV